MMRQEQTVVYERGATLVSFMVAAVLAGIVGITVMRLATTQGKALVVITLLEEREQILKNYANILVDGWDRTRDVSKSETTRPPYNNTPLKVYNRDGTLAIKSDGSTTSPNKAWWKVKALATSITDSSVKVEIVITFDNSKHWANLGKVIADREEWIYLHSPNITASQSPSLNMNCTDNTHPTRTGYSGEGAIIQYDFNTNYTKCSSVPLIQPLTCNTSNPIIGFNSDTGEPICSSDHVSIVTGHCLSPGKFIQRVKADGSVACNDTSQRVAIVNPKNKRYGPCGIVSFSDTETHLYDPTWLNPITDRFGVSRGPAGDPPRRNTLEEAGGIRGIGNDGKLLPCSRFKPPAIPITSKGKEGDKGEKGVKGLKGPKGPACNELPSCKGETGNDGQQLAGPPGDPAPRPPDPRGNEFKGADGTCYTSRCSSSSDCSYRYCVGSCAERTETVMVDCYDDDGNKLPNDCPVTRTEKYCTGSVETRYGTCTSRCFCDMPDDSDCECC